MRTGLAGQDLAGPRETAEPGCDVEGSTPVTAFRRHGLTGVEPDSDPEWEGRLPVDSLAEALLQLHGRPERRTGRAKDAQRFIATQLEHVPASRGDGVIDDRRKPPHDGRSCLIALFVAEARVAADVGDQEGVKLALVA